MKHMQRPRAEKHLGMEKSVPSKTRVKVPNPSKANEQAASNGQIVPNCRLRLGKGLLFPHPAVISLLTPIAAAGLIYGFVALEENDGRRIPLYALSFYALMVLVLRVPAILARARKFRRENRCYLRYATDIRLRMRISLWGSFFYNAAYAAFQLALGLRHHSAWFYAMAEYYCLLALMRLTLGRHVHAFAIGAEKRIEWRKYRLCGAGLLAMNAALTVFIVYFVRNLRATQHHEITVIAMATYTFGALALAIANMARYRRYESPACSAAKALSLASAAVSMLSLENAMLTTFGDGNSPRFQRFMLGATGAAVSLFILGMAIYMIVHATRQCKIEKE